MMVAIGYCRTKFDQPDGITVDDQQGNEQDNQARATHPLTGLGESPDRRSQPANLPDDLRIDLEADPVELRSRR